MACKRRLNIRKDNMSYPSPYGRRCRKAADEGVLNHIPLTRPSATLSRKGRGVKRFACLMLILVGSYALADTPNDLTSVQLNHPTSKTTELELKFDKTPNFNYFTLPSPSRLVFDVNDATVKAHMNSIDWVNTPIVKMRLGHQANGSLRIVFEFNNTPKMQIQQINSSVEHVVLVDFVNLSGDAPSSLATTHPNHISQVGVISQAVIKPKPTPPPPVKVKPPVSKSPVLPPKPLISEVPNKTKHNIVVVIDPGHGGKDPGASGSRGEKEKDVVLGISQHLYQILDKEPGVTPVMTRRGDYYLTLRQRLDVARDAHADVFIAIHADAYPDTYSHGASVYALSLKGASSEAARWLAEKENYSELGGVDLNGKGDMLRSVLIDLSQTATISSSLLLGQAILQDLGQLGALHHGDKVEQAPFVVLKSPDIPSVLVETGFISNPNEAQHLENPNYEQAVAVAIAQGLNHYVRESPPIET